MIEETQSVGENAPSREEELRREVAACKSRLNEMADLAARVRHEINNPLTGLIGQAQLLLRDDTLSEPARRRVQTIEQLAGRIRDQIAELRVVQHSNVAGAENSFPPYPPDRKQTDDPPRH